MKKRILVLAPFFGADGRWIDDFCRRADLEFRKPSFPRPVAPWHARGAATPPAEWLGYFGYAARSMRWRPDCVVTSFPQLALATAALLALGGHRATRLVAWNFNLGSISRRWKGRLAGMPLARVDRFVVHARSEIGSYARWLGLDEARFRFIPLQRGRIGEVAASPIPQPYIVSMGSANRDYRTLIDAVAGTGIRTVVIAGRSLLDSLPEHPGLVKLHGLTPRECDSVLGGAALSVVPISSTETASGQVTFTTSMRMGVATVATRCVGTVDYLRDGETGLLVPPGDARALRRAVETLWRDEALRRRIAEAGRRHADEHFSDEAAGRHLAAVIDEVLAQ